MPYNYSDAEINKRVRSGKDKERADKNTELFNKATQPPADDDAWALQQLQIRAGGDDVGGLATNDGRNHARMLLNDLGGPQQEYAEARDGGGFLGSVGDVLKVAAPIGAAFIPGIGPIAAGAIGAAGSAAGGALKGEDFDLKKTLMAGVGSGVGSHLLGGQGIGGIGGIPGKLGLGGGAAAGNTTAGGLVGQTSGGGGFLGKVGGFLGGKDGFGMDDVLKIGGTVSAIDAQRSANQQRDGAVQGATNDWNSRAPLRTQAMQGIQNLGNVQRPDMGHVFADPSNPFYRAPKPLTQRYG